MTHCGTPSDKVPGSTMRRYHGAAAFVRAVPRCVGSHSRAVRVSTAPSCEHKGSVGLDDKRGCTGRCERGGGGQVTG